LTHTSGLTVSGDAFWAAWNANVDKTTTTQMARDLAAIPLQYRPGERFEYGPTGAAYEVLGAVIEIVSGVTLEDYMIENIFEPLNLKDTYFYVPDEKKHRLPAFYSRRDGPIELSRNYAEEFPRSDYYFGGGGVSASPQDILRFARLFTDGGSVDGARILEMKTVEQMTTDQLGELAPDSWKAAGRSWGFGAAVSTNSGEVRAIAQEQYGWNGGGYAKLWVDNRQNIIAYIAFPLDPPGDNDLLRDFERLVYEAINSPQ
jgi:CubicO group peptidase (beta-lactamase class C family)